jgi:hypothetical protein
MAVIEKRTRVVEPLPADEPLVDPEALIEEARRRQRRRRRLVVLALGLALTIAAGAYLAVHLGDNSASTQHPQPPAVGAATHRSPIRVILTAQNHHPRVLLTGRNHQPPPSEQWGYCVNVRTATGKPLAAPIHLLLQILKGRTPVAGVGEVWLKKGYDNWCGSIGGEANALLAVPRGTKLNFQADVRAMGVTVKRNWPIVVR